MVGLVLELATAIGADEKTGVQIAVGRRVADTQPSLRGEPEICRHLEATILAHAAFEDGLDDDGLRSAEQTAAGGLVRRLGECGRTQDC